MLSRLNDYSVRTKVMVALTCMLLATLALGGFTAWRLMVLKTDIVAFTDNWLPGIRDVGDLKFIAMRYRQRQAVYLLLTTDAERAKEQANLKKLQGEFAAIYTRYAADAEGEEEKATARGVGATWDAYIAHEPAMFALVTSSGQAAAASDYGHAAKRLHDALKKELDADSKHHMGGGVLSGTDAKEVVTAGVIWIFIGLAGALAVCVAAGIVLIRSVSTPLVDITQAMGELAAGHLEAPVPHADRDDEVGKLAGTMTTFKNQLVAAERSKAEQIEIIVGSIGTGLEQLAKGDVTHRVSASLTGPFNKLKTDFNAAMERLQETLQSVLSSTGQITSGADEIAAAADDLARRTEQQAASLEETTAALEEITVTVKKTASNAKDARASVSSATGAAEDGDRVVGTAIEAMNAISQSSKQITDIIGVIDEIAFQTNLLALNAGVEAARAGDAGRGFAVVASEVRALAQRSSDAAKQIKTLINTSGEQVDAGVKLVGESGAALRQIMAQVQQINGLVSEMAQAAEQQSTGIEQVNAAIAQMDQATQQNAAMVEESTAASRNLASETQTLNELVSFFSVGQPTASSTTRSAPGRRDLPLRKPAPRAASGRLAVARSAPDNDWAEF
jgi:methyl-accepting chemotaxis protein